LNGNDKSRSRARALALLASLQTFAGCVGGAAVAGAAPQAVGPAASERSVRPGANDQYLVPDLDVSAWQKRLEREGREVFERRAAILEASGITAGMTVADVGAGTGLFSLLMAKRVGPQGQVLAVDIAPRFLAHIEAAAREHGVKNVRTVRGDARVAPLGASSVDLIFVCDTYHHFEYPRSMNASLWKALRPGGTLVLIDFRRVKGQSAPWILEHVRAGQEVFTRELEAAGFQKVEELPLLKENYFLRFRKPLPDR
jgi:ubiquinone/menaquinone biosynthesis C-methylase UbiE